MRAPDGGIAAHAAGVRRLWRLAWLLILLAAAPAGAAALLHAGTSTTGLERQMRYAVDTGAGPEAVARAWHEGRFTPDFAAVEQATAPYQPLWAAVEVALPAGQPAAAWIPTMGTQALLGLQVYAVRASGPPQLLLDHSVRRPFAPEQHAVDRLRAAPLALAPGETALLLLRIDFGLQRSVQLDLLTADDLARRSLRAGLALAAFYAFALSTLVFFAGFHLALANPLGLAYSGLFLLGLVFVAYGDGLLLRHLHPEHPHWHNPIGFALLLGLSAAGFLTAAAAMAAGAAQLPRAAQPPRANRSVRRLRGVALIPAAGLLGIAALDSDLMAWFAVLCVVAMLGAQVRVAARARDLRPRASRLPLLLATAATLAAVAMLIALAGGWRADALPLAWAPKVLYALFAVATLGAMTQDVLALKREHAQAQAARLAALEQEARTSRQLLEAERAHARVRELAELRQRQLATASHDLKQPLASLRMTLDALLHDREPAQRERVRDAFDYLERLASSHLAQARPDTDDTAERVRDEAGSGVANRGTGAPAALALDERARAAGAGHPADADARAHDAAPRDAMQARTDTDAVEPYPLSLVFGTVRQMFTEAAVSRGLRLRVVDSSAAVTVPPLALMRIVSNLVSNAVKYTERGRVLLGARRDRDHVRVQVLDTGCGMSEAEIAAFAAAYAKGERSDGEGLGLAICHRLAAEHGLTLVVRSAPRTGTCFEIRIPLA